MTLARSLVIAAGAGIAGLCLGLIIGDRPAVLEPNAAVDGPAEPGANMVAFARTEQAPELVNALVAHFSAHGAQEVKIVDAASPSQFVLSSVWPSAAAAEAAINDPEYELLSATGPASQDMVQVAIIPINPADGVR